MCVSWFQRKQKSTFTVGGKLQNFICMKDVTSEIQAYYHEVLPTTNR